MKLGRRARFQLRKSPAVGTAAGAAVVLLVLFASPLSPVSGTATTLALAIPAKVRIPRVNDPRPGAPALRALFSHPQHGFLRCYQCHPGLFPQARLAFRHADMEQGRACGSCHDGRRTTAVTALTCEKCHALY